MEMGCRIPDLQSSFLKDVEARHQAHSKLEQKVAEIDAGMAKHSALHKAKKDRQGSDHSSSVQERLDYLEKLMGDSAERHARDLAAAHRRIQEWDEEFARSEFKGLKGFGHFERGSRRPTSWIAPPATPPAALREGRVIEEFCARLLPSGLTRTQSVPSRLQELVQLGDEVHREKPKPGSPARMRAARGAAGESDLVSHDGRQLRFGYRPLQRARRPRLVWSLSALWIVGSAWATHAVLKLCTVMCFARPKLLPPESILPSASSSIRHLPGKDQASALDSLTPLQMYTLSGNAVIANALLNSEPLLPSGPSSLLVIGHSMGAITAAAVAVSQARQGTVVNLILESPAFLTNPTKHLKSSTIGAVTALSLRFQRAFLRLVLQLPGLTYNRRFWERGLSVASQLDGEALKRQVLRYRWPSLSVRWAYGLSNFVTARLITMEDALVLHELIEEGSSSTPCLSRDAFSVSRRSPETEGAGVRVRSSSQWSADPREPPSTTPERRGGRPRHPVDLRSSGWRDAESRPPSAPKAHGSASPAWWEGLVLLKVQIRSHKPEQCTWLSHEEVAHVAAPATQVQARSGSTAMSTRPQALQPIPVPQVIALPSLSEQRWTGVHRVLADLESAVADVVRRRRPALHAGPVAEPERPAARLGRSDRVAEADACGTAVREVNAVQQDPAACKPSTPVAAPSQPTGALQAFRLEPSQPQTASTQADLCGHGLHGLNAHGERLNLSLSVEATAVARGTSKNAPTSTRGKSTVPFQLGVENEKLPDESTYLETTASLEEEPVAATAPVAPPIAARAQATSSTLLRQTLTAWRSAAAAAAILGSDSGSESEADQRPLGATPVPDQSNKGGRPFSQPGPFSLGDSSGEDGGLFRVPSMACAVPSMETSPSALRPSPNTVEDLDVVSASSGSSGDSLASGRVERLEVQSANSDSSSI
eukprot:g31233.t1